MNEKINKRILGMTQTELLILVAMGGLLLCVLLLFGYIIYVNRSNLVATLPPTSILQPTPNPLNGGDGMTVQVLAAQDVFEVSAIDLVVGEGYTVTSAVCEVVSSESYSVQGYDFWKIIFHAFRITGPTLGTESVVLFASNHTARDGSGFIQTANPLAIALFPDFPDGPNLKHPITMDTPGAQEAIECAMQAGPPSAIDMGNFDVEAWRRKAIAKFGPEKTFDDGSKDDYVRLAFSLCRYKELNPNMIYEEGSDQQWIIETFCVPMWSNP